MSDLLDIDFDIEDLLGSSYLANNIVTDGHKPEVRQQSREKSDQGNTKPIENEIEEKMENLVM